MAARGPIHYLHTISSSIYRSTCRHMDIEHAFTQHRHVCTCGRARADTIREGASACVSGALASAAARTWCLRICNVYLHEYLHAYMFIYARGSGTANVSGTKTPAAAMIELAGGENAISEYEGFKPLTSEGLINAAPDIILMPERGLQSIGGKGGLMKLAGIAETPAGKNGKIITMEDLMLLGFTPRVGKAVNELCQKLR